MVEKNNKYGNHSDEVGFVFLLCNYINLLNVQISINVQILLKVSIVLRSYFVLKGPIIVKGEMVLNKETFIRIYLFKLYKL